MLERISSVPGTLIKSLAADGYFVIRRVDFENDRLFALAEKESVCAP